MKSNDASTINNTYERYVRNSRQTYTRATINNTSNIKAHWLTHDAHAPQGARALHAIQYTRPVVNKMLNHGKGGGGITWKAKPK